MHVFSILQIGNYNQMIKCYHQKQLNLKNGQINNGMDERLELTQINQTSDGSIIGNYTKLINLLKNSDHLLSSDLQNSRTGMDYSDEQFNEIMINLQFKKNEPFKSNPKNLSRTIDYIHKMSINQNSFEVLEYLIKEFGVAILYSFQPFYKRIINDQEAQKKYEPQLQRISALALYMINFGKYGQLKFFSIAGTAKKGFKLKQKTPEELEFIQDLDFIRNCLILKKENPQLESLPKDRLQKLVQIRQKVQNHKLNPFMCFYINRMLVNVSNQFKFQKIQGSTADQEPEILEFKKKAIPSPPVDCATLPSIIKIEQLQEQQQNIKLKQIPTDNLKISETQQISAQPNLPKAQTQKNTLPSTQESSIQSFDLKNKPSNIKNENEGKNQKAPILKSEIQQIPNQKKQKKTTTIKDSKTSSSKNDSLQDTRDQTANSMNFSLTGTGVNFALIPLCCRTYFFDQERILPAEDKRTEYKSYRFPFNPASIETFKKTICAFLNTIGGQIYIGIKETTNKKYRYILGNYLTENDKQQVLKSFRKISESIYPNITRDFQVEFVPIRQSAFPQLNLLNQIEAYCYDFSKKEFKIDNYPFKPARYVIRVRVPMGVREEMYSYIQTQYQLNKNSNSNEFIPFRSQNQVLVKEISQEVLKKFKEKLIRGNQKGWEIHKGSCKKPQLGNPRNEQEPPQEMIDAKQIEASLVNLKKNEHLQGKLQPIFQDTHEDTQSEYSLTQKSNISTHSKTQQSNALVTEQELRKIFKYPLGFIVLRMSKDRLKKCIDKTPAKDYTLISQQKNELTGSDLLLIRVNAYSHMEQFLRIKEKLENHFQKDKVQFVGVSKILKLQNFQNRRIAEQILSKNDHKHAFNNKNLQFYSLIAAASYLLYMRQLGYRVQAIPD